jgi:hypothetical protein
MKPGSLSFVNRLYIVYAVMKGLPIIIQPMEERIYHGSLTPETIARALTAQYDRGSL